MRASSRAAMCLLLALIILFTSTTALAAGGRASKKAPMNSLRGEMSDFERRIVEQGFRLLPYDHPFVVAYEATYGDKIDSFVTTINGITLSGVPFEFGGKWQFAGFSERWWTPTGVKDYPVGGLDCAGYIAWVYYQLGIEIPIGSAGQFLAGQSGVLREISGVRPHYVLPSLDEALIGDIAYNSEDYSYRSGHGSHTQLYLGSASKLGISEALLQIYPDFPCDAHLVLDCGWSDGSYYYDRMRKLKTRNARKSMAGVGVQFFSSIKAGSKYLYRSPKSTYKWKSPSTGFTYRIESRLEKNGRLLQYKPSRKIEYPINIARPVQRPDV